MWGTDSLLLWEKLYILSSLPILGHWAGNGIYGEIVSQRFPTLLWYCFPPTCPIRGSWSANFYVFFRENYSTYICRFSMFVGGSQLRIYLCCHLGLETLQSIFIKILPILAIAYSNYINININYKNINYKNINYININIIQYKYDYININITFPWNFSETF